MFSVFFFLIVIRGTVKDEVSPGFPRFLDKGRGRAICLSISPFTFRPAMGTMCFLGLLLVERYVSSVPCEWVVEVAHSVCHKKVPRNIKNFSSRELIEKSEPAGFEYLRHGHFVG